MCSLLIAKWCHVNLVSQGVGMSVVCGVSCHQCVQCMLCSEFMMIVAVYPWFVHYVERNVQLFCDCERDWIRIVRSCGAMREG